MLDNAVKLIVASMNMHSWDDGEYLDLTAEIG